MSPGTIRQIQKSPFILLAMGFTQQTNKPWLFRYRLPHGSGNVYADFGSTEEVAVWEDPAALVYCYLKEESDVRHDALLPLVLERCDAAGADVRVSFYNQHLDQRARP